MSGGPRPPRHKGDDPSEAADVGGPPGPSPPPSPSDAEYTRQETGGPRPLRRRCTSAVPLDTPV